MPTRHLLAHEAFVLELHLDLVASFLALELLVENVLLCILPDQHSVPVLPRLGS